MIISCENCDKNFEIDTSLIPDKGRMLQCGSCNYKWFFKRKIINDPIIISKNENNESIKLLDETPNQQVIFDNNTQKIETNIEEEKISDKILKSKKKKKKIKILNLLIVFIVSFAALIIILDTFKSQINKVFPNIEFLLYNLYESFKDIELFIKDLF